MWGLFSFARDPQPAPDTTLEPDPWKPHKEWEDGQGVSHYRETYAHGACLVSAPWYQEAARNLMQDPQRSIAYQYCFGYFAPLVVLHRTKYSVKELLACLLAMYDICRGYGSLLRGNRAEIAAIHAYIEQGDIELLAPLRDPSSAYPYTYLHGHTVAARCMSSLIVRFAQNLLHQSIAGFPAIKLTACLSAANKVVWSGQSLCLNLLTVRTSPRCMACNMTIDTDDQECSSCRSTFSTSRDPNDNHFPYSGKAQSLDSAGLSFRAREVQSTEHLKSLMDYGDEDEGTD